MELSSERLALTNISFLVSDAALVSEDMLIGLPVLQHLGIDLRLLLECNPAVLDGTDCSAAPHPSVSKTCGSFGRLMIARHQRVTGQELIDDSSTTTPHAPPSNPKRPRENYFAHKFDEDPFPDPNLLDLDDKSKDDAEIKYIEAMIQQAIDNDFEARYVKPLRDLFWEFRSTFSILFCRIQSKFDPLHI